MKSKNSKASTLKGDQSHLIQLSTIFMVGLLAWGLILFTDYLLYDSWWTCYLLQNKDRFWCFKQICNEIGRPLDITFFLPLTFFTDPVFVAKFIGVSSHIAQAFLFSMCLQVAFRISKMDGISHRRFYDFTILDDKVQCKKVCKRCINNGDRWM